MKIITTIIFILISFNVFAKQVNDRIANNLQRTYHILDNIADRTGLNLDRPLNYFAEIYADFKYGGDKVYRSENWLDTDVKRAWIEDHTGAGVTVNVYDQWNNPYVANTHGKLVKSIIKGDNLRTSFWTNEDFIGIAPDSRVSRWDMSRVSFRNPNLYNADIVNMSIGSRPKPVEWTAEDFNINTNALVVKSAGNHGSSCITECDYLSRSIIQTFGDNALIVGAVDTNNTITNYSNKAGVTKDNYVVDYGTHVAGDYHSQGTSFSAPRVSGKAALIKSKFPTLTGSGLAHVIKTTADDLGAPGVDDVYGHGKVNLARALSPIGSIN